MGLETDFGEALIQPFITRTFSTPDLTALGGKVDLPKEGLDEGPLLGEFAFLPEFPHVLGERCDGLDIVEYLPALRHQRPRLLSRGIRQILMLAADPDSADYSLVSAKS